MNKLNNLALPIVILVASLIFGGFFYLTQLEKQKSIERQQQIELQEKKKEKEEAKKAQEEVKQELNTCLTNAEESYYNNWRRECKSQGLLTDRCIYLNETTFSEYTKENKIPDDNLLDAMDAFYKEKDDCSCRLPFENADRKRDIFQKDRDVCFKMYPQKN